MLNYYKDKMNSIENLIIGAGPSGLAMGKHFHQNQIPFKILEKATKVADLWRNQYDRLHLHTVKWHSHLPYKKFPKEYPTYVSKDQLIEYLEDYAKDFETEILFQQKVINIEKKESLWQVDTLADSFQAKRIIITTGRNRMPKIAQIPTIENFKGELIHSIHYRNGEKYKDKSVLVVGMGNTGAELALDLYEYGAKAFVSVRSPVSIFPRDIFGQPTQDSAIFFDRFPNCFTDWLSNISQKMTIGSLEKYGLQQAKSSASELLREKGKIPVVDLGTVELIKKGKIKILPDIKTVKSNTVIFENDEEIRFDAIILATGYTPSIEEFFKNSSDLLDKNLAPKKLYFEEVPNLYFLGFDTPAIGILKSIHRDSFKIIKHILENKKDI